MSLITVQYRVSSAGFQPGDIVTVEDSPYVRARLGTIFVQVGAPQDVVEAPETPEDHQEPTEPVTAPESGQETPEDDDDGSLPE